MIRLIYTSAHAPGFDRQAFDQLCTYSSNKNMKLGIDGLLLWNGLEFIQCLEGPQEAVISMYKKISVDTRHSDIRVLVWEKADQRLFRKWSMMGFSMESKSLLSPKSIAYTLLDQRLYRPWKHLGYGVADLIYEYANVKSGLEKAGETEPSEQGVWLI